MSSSKWWPCCSSRSVKQSEPIFFLGGIGDAVAGAVSEERDICVKKLAVNGVPRSGKPAELMAMFKIDADAICKAVKGMLKA